MTDSATKNPNTNCLEHMRCPNCGATEPFRIVATSWFRIFDDGVDDYGDVEWDAASYCRCEACNYTGIVADFTPSSD